MPISEARRRIFEIAEEAQKPDTYFTLTENGRPKAVLMSAEEFESWRETLEVMRDCPDLGKEIREAEEDLKSGAYLRYATLEEVLAKEGFVLADKSKRGYVVAHHHQAKRGKKSSKNPR